MSLNYQKILLIYIFTLFIITIIPTGSAVALNEIHILTHRADYLLHALIFFPWMILVWLHLKETGLKGKARLKTITYWFIAGLMLAVLSEVLQLWLPHRAYNIIDLIYNLAGLMLGTLIFFWKPEAKKPDPSRVGF